MNNTIDVPLPESKCVIFTPYDHGMHDEWFGEGDNSFQYYGEYRQLYRAGRRNVTILLKTLRNNF